MYVRMCVSMYVFLLRIYIADKPFAFLSDIQIDNKSNIISRKAPIALHVHELSECNIVKILPCLQQLFIYTTRITHSKRYSHFSTCKTGSLSCVIKFHIKRTTRLHMSIYSQDRTPMGAAQSKGRVTHKEHAIYLFQIFATRDTDFIDQYPMLTLYYSVQQFNRFNSRPLISTRTLSRVKHLYAIPALKR